MAKFTNLSVFSSPQPLSLIAMVLACSSCFYPVTLFAGGYKNCVTLMGNGFRGPVHLGALSRLVEDHGEISAISSSSSAAIIALLYHSLASSPVLQSCGEDSCSPEQRRIRIGLLLKSMPVFYEALYKSNGFGNDLRWVFSSAKRLGSFFSYFRFMLPQESGGKSAQGLKGLFPVKVGHLFAAGAIYMQRHLRDFITDSYYRKIGLDPAGFGFDFGHLDYSSAAVLANFILKPGFKDQAVFFEDGLANFATVVNFHGLIADFYAGYDDAANNGLTRFLHLCGRDSRGVSWLKMSLRPAEGGQNCGQYLETVALDFINKNLENRHKSRRLQDKVGQHGISLLTTALVTGQGVLPLEAARKAGPNRYKKFKTSKEDLRVGVFGDDESLRAALTGSEQDALSIGSIGLEGRSWFQALTRVISEPGAAPYFREKVGEDTHLSIGGWIDQNQSIYLKNLGCERVFAVAKGEPARFAPAIAELLTENHDFVKTTFGLGDGSVLRNRIRLSDGIFCAYWENLPDIDYWAHLELGYQAPLYSQHQDIVHQSSRSGGRLRKPLQCFLDQSTQDEY